MDPLSPFIFTLVVDMLSRLMDKVIQNKLVKGFRIVIENMMVSNLVDDTLFF